MLLTWYGTGKREVMTQVLVTYVTKSGSTRDVAEAIAEEMNKAGVEARILPLKEVKDVSGYAAVVLGAPMIMGWHKDALNYLKKHKEELKEKPLALFLTGMSLTDVSRPELPGVELHVDSRFVVPPVNADRLTFKENFATPQNYLRPILKVSPESLSAIGLFGGRLDMYRLKWYEALFVMAVVGAKPGEKRNWPDIRAWAAGLPALFKLKTT
jgi:menaquinone-dependent protoporphyrinogen oxidase